MRHINHAIHSLFDINPAFEMQLIFLQSTSFQHCSMK